jgi:hypothetical protein
VYEKVFPPINLGDISQKMKNGCYKRKATCYTQTIAKAPTLLHTLSLEIFLRVNRLNQEAFSTKKLLVTNRRNSLRPKNYPLQRKYQREMIHIKKAFFHNR